MQRRDFVKNTALLAIGLGFGNVKQWYAEGRGSLRLKDLAVISDP